MTNKQANLEISVKELKQRLDKGEDLLLLDIREGHELDIAKLNHNKHIPMGELSARVGELEVFKSRDIVVMCRSGGRSMRCVQFLRSKGFDSAINLAGGILAWSDEIDNSIPKY